MMRADQILGAHKAQRTALHAVSSNVLATVERFAQLNPQASQAVLDEGAEKARTPLNVKDIDELTKLRCNARQLAGGESHVLQPPSGDNAAGRVAGFGQLAEAPMAEVLSQFVVVVEVMMKSVSRGAEFVVAAVRCVLSTAATPLVSCLSMEDRGGAGTKLHRGRTATSSRFQVSSSYSASHCNTVFVTPDMGQP